MRELLDRALTEARDDWHVPRRLAVAIMLFPVVGACIDVLLSNTERPWMHWLAKENGIIQWGQFILYALAVFLAVGAAREFRRAGKKLPTLGFLMFAAVNFFLAGEEVDWGQRVFDFGTPRAIEKDNVQQATDVHNLHGARSLFVAGQALIGIYGFIVTLYVRVSRKARGEWVDLLFPPLFLVPAFFVVFVWRAAGPFVPDKNIYDIIYGEWSELCIAMGFSLFAGLTWLRLHLAARAPALVS